MAILASTVAPCGACRASPFWGVRGRIKILSNGIERFKGCYELLFFFVDKLRVLGLV